MSSETQTQKLKAKKDAVKRLVPVWAGRNVEEPAVLLDGADRLTASFFALSFCVCVSLDITPA